MFEQNLELLKVILKEINNRIIRYVLILFYYEYFMVLTIGFPQ